MTSPTPHASYTLSDLPGPLAVYIKLEDTPEGATQRELAESLDRAPSTISKALALLERAGIAYPTLSRQGSKRGRAGRPVIWRRKS